MLAKNQKSDRKSIFLQFTGVEGHENWGPNWNILTLRVTIWYTLYISIILVIINGNIGKFLSLGCVTVSGKLTKEAHIDIKCDRVYDIGWPAVLVTLVFMRLTELVIEL